MYSTIRLTDISYCCVLDAMSYLIADLDICLRIDYMNERSSYVPFLFCGYDAKRHAVAVEGVLYTPDVKKLDRLEIPIAGGRSFRVSDWVQGFSHLKGEVYCDARVNQQALDSLEALMSQVF